MTAWEKCVAFHGHSCGGLTIGYKAATIPLPRTAKIFDSYDCDCCGEKTGANWIRLAGDKKLCLDCYESYNRFDV